MEPANRISDGSSDIWTMVNEAAKASKIQPVVNLGQGFFSYNPPQFMLDALKDTVDRVECNQYAPTLGRPRLRKAVADAYGTSLGRRIDPNDEVLITTGANEGILSAIMAYVNPGDEVIIMEPYFDQFVRNVHMAGGVTKFVTLHPPPLQGKATCTAAEWRLDMDELHAAVGPRTKMLILNTPHNPTGKVFTPIEITEITNFCDANSLILLSDEVYARLSKYPSSSVPSANPFPHPAPLYPKGTLTIGSAGKDFAATGWRVGYVVGVPQLLSRVATAHARICFATPCGAQEAAAVGYEEAERRGYWERNREEMCGRVKEFCEGVCEGLGVPYVKPEGGYLVLVSLARLSIPEAYEFPAEIAQTGDKDVKICWFIIHEFGVGALPASGFYSSGHPDRNMRFFRFAVCRESHELELAKTRLRGLAKHILLEDG